VDNRSVSRGQLFGLLLCFFLSGAAGLVYQVAWGKALGLVFGNTVYAIATVLAVFMGGLALGSAWWGRRSERSVNPVALYGWMELAIAATGALSLLGLSGVRSLYISAYPLVAGSAPALLALRFAGSAMVLLLPTFLMGGTLPVLVQGLTRSSADLGARVSRLYWVNTLGAVTGTIAAGFLLLPAYGQRRTVAAAAMINVIAGVVALALARRVAPAPAAVESSPPASDVESQPAGFLLTCFAVVGATAIAYEIGWTRLLVTYLGSSTYAFTLMLATFLAGIVLGTMIFEAWMARGGKITLGAFAMTQTLTAVAALGFLVYYQQLPGVVPALLRATSETFAGLVYVQFVTSALAMLPAAAIFGFNFPLVVVLIAGRDASRPGRGAAVGRAYAANTVGAIAGATSVGFFLMPRLGGFRLLALVAATNLILAGLLRLRDPQRRPLMLAANGALLAAVIFVVFSGAFYNRAVATFGAILYYDLYDGKLSVAEQAATTDVIFVADGLNATVSVATSEDYIAVRTNGKVDASNRDQLTQYMAGHLGALFHPAPKRVLVIGFGSGMTLASVARYPDVEHIDCVEIEPGMIQAAPYLERLNRGVLRDPRVHVVLDDARNFLLTTREQYDLIVSEPSNPWIAGVSALFTDEFYREARARLRPGGMLVQWVQGYALFTEDFRMVLSTFVPHFPRVTLWRGELPDFLLLAQTDTRPLDLRRLHSLWPNEGLQQDFDALNLSEPEGLLAYHRLDDVDLRRLIDPALRNTDDNSRLEFHAPRALLSHNLADSNIDMVWKQRTATLPRDILFDDPRQALLAAAHSALLNDDSRSARYFIKPVLDDPPSYAVEILLARLAEAREDYDAARERFTAALHLDPSSMRAATGIADAALQNKEYDTAELLYRQVLGRQPDYLRAMQGLVKVLRQRENWPEAALWQARQIAADAKPDADDYATLGEVLLHTGDTKNAEEAFRSALKRDSYSNAAHRDLGNLFRQRKDWQLARQHLEFVIRYFPDNDASSYVALAEVYQELGKRGSAQEVLSKGLRVFPDDAGLKRLAP
jgi:spermidine synthase